MFWAWVHIYFNIKLYCMYKSSGFYKQIYSFTCSWLQSCRKAILRLENSVWPVQSERSDWCYFCFVTAWGRGIVQFRFEPSSTFVNSWQPILRLFKSTWLYELPVELASICVHCTALWQNVALCYALCTVHCALYTEHCVQLRVY